MPFRNFMTDRVTLIKPGGNRREGIPASVQRGKVFIEDSSIIIEPGDVLERVTSNGLRELLEVVDPGFHEKFGGIGAHYQVEVRKVSAVPSRPALTTTTPEPASGLHPWGVVAALLFELDSDEVVELVSLSGLRVDWSLTTKEGYSHATRKRAYRPRVDDAFSELGDGESLRVAWVVSSELIRRHPEKESQLRDRLSAISWTLDGGVIRPSSGDVAELFFATGSEHDAYVKVRDIVKTAKSSITIVDPYVDTSVLTILATLAAPLDIRILSFKLTPDFDLEVSKFAQQHRPKSLEVRRTKEFHDRFVILDGKRCYHVGASIKDAGLRAFMVSQVQDPANVRALLKQVDDSWNTATGT
jgi:hypothetical protein